MEAIIIVTESNNVVTVRCFTVAADSVYDETAKYKPQGAGDREEVFVMTFGEKLKEARKEAGLSQEQLSEKMSVSRSAIAKWESDKGMPDVNNLKIISQLLDVSVDYLLDEDEKLSFNETKEAIDLDSFEVSGKCRDKRDAACYSRFSGADAIYPLIRRKKMSKAEWVTDLIAGPGIIQGADYLSDNSTYYLIESGGRQLLVSVSSDFITSRELANKVDPKKFDFGNHTFKKATYRLI
jgi:transcriptional regulator with XRE-family HTH domain